MRDVPNSESYPAWASWLGVVIVTLGVLLTAVQGNEWLTHKVVGPPQPAAERPEADCPEDELEEEGLSLAECEQMVANVRSLQVSRPDWFRGFAMASAATGAAVAFGSIFVGAGLVNYRRWAPPAALAVLGALALIDVAQFAAVTQSGPIVRQMYLWDTLLWLLLHLVLIVGVAAGSRNASPTDGPG